MPASDGFTAPAVRIPARSAPESVVLHVIGCRSVQHGSYEDYLLSVARSCRDRGLVPVFLYPDEPESAEYATAMESAGARIEVVPGTDSPGFACAAALWAAMTRLRPAAVHAHFGRVGYLTVLLARLHRCPQVFLTKHQMSDEPITFRHRLTYRMLGAVANTVFCVSDPVRQQLAQLGLRARKLRVSTIGVDVRRFRPDETSRFETRQALGLTEAQTAVVCVSHLRPRKGLEYLVDAMAALSKSAPEVLLLVCGEGVLRGELESRVRERGIEDSVRFLGMRHDVPALLTAADIFVNPSLSEGGCSSVLEAMASGVPVVSTPVGYAVDLIEDGSNGVLVPLADSEAIASSLSALAQDRPVWAEMGLSARYTIARRFGLATEARRVTDYYEACLSHTMSEA